MIGTTDTRQSATKDTRFLKEIAFVAGFRKTDRIVTLGLFRFIGPANGYTCTLHILSAIIRLG